MQPLTADMRLRFRITHAKHCGTQLPQTPTAEAMQESLVLMEQ